MIARRRLSVSSNESRTDLSSWISELEPTNRTNLSSGVSHGDCMVKVPMIGTVCMKQMALQTSSLPPFGVPS